MGAVNEQPSVRAGYAEEARPYDRADFWWWLDRSEGTIEIRALARRLGIDPFRLTNEQIAGRIWERPETPVVKS